MIGAARLDKARGGPAIALIAARLGRPGARTSSGTATKRIDWSQALDPGDPLGVELRPIHGSRTWERISRDEQELRRAACTRPAGNSASSCTEQAALITTARIVESVPDMDSKFSAATQTMGWSATVRAHQRA